MPLLLSRRAFSLGLPAASLIFGAQILPVRAANAPSGSAVTPLAQIRVGRFTVTALSDGYADMPYGYFPGRTPEQVEAAAKAQFTARTSGVRFLFNQYLVEDGSNRILIDSGPAGSMGHTGNLPQALAARGLGADQIDAVIVTHMHQDHVGGLVAGGRRSFPNAEVYVDRRDIVHWTDPGKQAAAPDYLQDSFRLSSDLVRLYPKLQATQGDHQIARGVSLIDLTGHTPGHIGVRIEDGGQSLIMVSDMLFPVVHPAMGTDVNFLLEQDRPAAQAMRARFFPRAAEEGALIAATHMPFPGLGRIVSDQGRLAWLPADWAYQD
ncbi:MBL fold metallo-hydrolase [Microvirga sp. Mcv34]|uniref:MBL fold metallo-hydrolase n=1 Tax=Microvirga sp. Mcv34 TaxID=2926016 RepID=UPI0021CA3100|nr:MBL fold metallo-hydrolase [Microvirga sp. Mcv34]